jgi:hypothetical protein
MGDNYNIIQLNKEGEVDKIYIFAGNDIVDENTRIQKLTPDDLDRPNIKKMLSKQLRDMIDTSRVKDGSQSVFIMNQEIYADDTFDIMKRKLAVLLDYELLPDEMYFFGLKEKTFSNEEMYSMLTNNSTEMPDYTTMVSILGNIYGFNVSSIEEKDAYTYDDIIGLNMDGKQIRSIESVGQQFLSEKANTIAKNPFNTLTIDRKLITTTAQLLTTYNNNTVLDLGTFANNTVYLCPYSSVAEFSKDVELDMKQLTKLYYPFLFEQNITTLDSLNREKPRLTTESRSMNKTNFAKYNKNIALLHQIYEKRTKDLEYIRSGLNNIHFSIIQNQQYNLPLDALFKLMNTTRAVPFIKFNPGKYKEPI